MKEPRIRFKGFEGDWEEEKLGKLGSIKAGGDVNKNKLLSNGKYPVISNGLNNNGIVGYYNDSYRIDPPSVTITGRGNIGIATPRYYKYTPIVRLLSFKTKMDVEFTSLEINKIHILNESTGVPQLTSVQLSKYKINYPQNNEQQRIGQFFQNLDQQIELQSQKLKHLKSDKQGYLQKMFPIKKHKCAKVRFKNFHSKWEILMIRDIAKVVGGGTPSTSNPDYWNGNINWYSPNEITEKPFSYESIKKITELGLKNSSAKIHPINTILFTSRAGIGKMTIIKNPASTNQGFQSLELKNNTYPYFIYSMNKIIKHKAILLASGSTFLEISKKSMEKIKLPIPSLPEQQRIGQFFSHLDHLINLQQQKVEHLKQLKQAYLQKMFV